MWDRILIVYGNEHVRLQIQEMLGETGLVVKGVANRQAALASALLEAFDLVIVERTLIEGSAGRLFKARLRELGVSILLAAPEAAWEIHEQLLVEA
jgi:DNA-binding response OmpR family regulator